MRDERAIEVPGKHSLSARALLCIALLTAALAGCGVRQARLEKTTVAVNAQWPPSAPLFVAEEKGYLRNEGLDVTFQPHSSGHLALAAMTSGKADFATAADTPMARAAVRGEPLVVVATISEVDRPNSIIARRDRGISTADDLRGKRIGVTVGSSAEFFLHVYLTVRHTSLDKVRIVDLSPDEIADALLGGDVDTVCTWTPYLAVLQQRLGSRALVLDDPDIYTMKWNLAATRKTAERHPERVKKLLRAVIRANSFIKEHPVGARAIAARHSKMDPAVLRKRWDTYTFRVTLDQSLIVDMEDQARWMLGRETGGNRRPPNLARFVHTEGLEAVQPEAVRIPGRR